MNANREALHYLCRQHHDGLIGLSELVDGARNYFFDVVSLDLSNREVTTVPSVGMEPFPQHITSTF